VVGVGRVALAGADEADHRGARRSLVRQPLEPGQVRVDELALEQQVLGWVAGEVSSVNTTRSAP
jgi:hypothetical protein